MSFQKEDNTKCQKRVQQILEEKKLWPQKGLKLECFKPKCFNCKIMANCKICVKNYQYNICKPPKNHGFFHCFKA